MLIGVGGCSDRQQQQWLRRQPLCPWVATAGQFWLAPIKGTKAMGVGVLLPSDGGKVGSHVVPIPLFVTAIIDVV